MAPVEIGIEQGQPVLGLLAVLDRRGPGQQHDLVGALGGRGPDLLAMDDIAAAGDPLGAGLDAGRIQPRIGLGHAEAGPLAPFDQGRQPGLLLRRRAVDHDRMRPEDIDMDRRGRTLGAGRAGDAVHHDRRLCHAQAGAAVLDRHGDAEPAALGDLGVEGLREGRGLFPFQPIAIVEPVDDAADRLANGLLVFRQAEIHGVILTGPPPPPPVSPARRGVRPRLTSLRAHPSRLRGRVRSGRSVVRAPVPPRPGPATGRGC